jgi:hypothetical protein
MDSESAHTHCSAEKLIAATRDSLQQRLGAEKLIAAMSFRQAQFNQLSSHINKF